MNETNKTGKTWIKERFVAFEGRYELVIVDCLKVFEDFFKNFERHDFWFLFGSKCSPVITVRTTTSTTIDSGNANLEKFWDEFHDLILKLFPPGILLKLIGDFSFKKLPNNIFEIFWKILKSILKMSKIVDSV